jgi:hypothetical protein
VLVAISGKQRHGLSSKQRTVATGGRRPQFDQNAI